jgi:hypothetical protein
MNNDKIHGLTGPFFGLCSLSPLGGSESVVSSLSLAVELGVLLGRLCGQIRTVFWAKFRC